MDFFTEEFDRAVKLEDSNNLPQKSSELKEVKNTFSDIKEHFYKNNPPIVPKYRPPMLKNIPLNMRYQTDMAPFRLNGMHVTYRSWFVNYSYEVNRCIYAGRELIEESYEELGIDLIANKFEKQGKVFVFDYCSSNFKGFNIFLWRSYDSFFTTLDEHSEVPLRVRNFIHSVTRSY